VLGVRTLDKSYLPLFTFAYVWLENQRRMKYTTNNAYYKART